MPRFALKYGATLTGLQSIAPTGSDLIFISFRCTRCNEETAKPASLDVSEESEIAGSRGTANLVQSCHFCKAEFSVSVEAASSFEALDVEKHEHEMATLLVVEARGCVPLSTALEGLAFTGKTLEGETVDIELEEEGEWYGASDAGDELTVGESSCEWVIADAVAGRKGKKM